jgi:DNA-binding transcriptional ArsR family regulator
MTATSCATLTRMNAPTHEPRIARVAAMVADPARSRMLCRLLSGEYATAGELAATASVSAATASEHLAKLQAAGFVVAEPRGRHRYFRLADAEVAHALEALAMVAERGDHDRQWTHPARQVLRTARCCYGHLAGRLGVQLFRTLVQRECLAAADNGYRLTDSGHAWLAALGIPGPAPQPRRRYAYACMDWSERNDHLAGQLADALLGHFVARGWLRRGDGRALQLTPTGRRGLLPHLDVPVAVPA